MSWEEIIRKNREWFPGATYHIAARGIRRTAIFQEDTDYQIILAILRRWLDKGDAALHAFCLMTNHIHLLIETGDVEIWKIMHPLLGNYAGYFNNRYGYRGHLFEDRYKAVLIKDDNQFIQASRYIHINPVKAKMVQNAEEYKWSSYKTIIGMGDDGITSVKKTIAYFPNGGRTAYRDFVEDKSHKYQVIDEEIHKEIEEDELWLPW